MNSPILNTISARRPADTAAEVASDILDTRMGALLQDAGKLNPEDVERVLRESMTLW